MIELTKSILNGSNIQCKILINPNNETTSALNMITDILRKKKLIKIAIRLKYTPRNYGLLILDNETCRGEWFETYGGLNKTYTNVFKPYFKQNKITITEYSMHFRTTENNVGLYAMYAL